MDTYIYLLITMAFSAFFSGMEIAFVSVDKLRFEMERKDGVTSRILSYFFRNSNNFISTMLVGNNIALVIYGILMAQVIKVHLLGDLISNDFVEVLLQTVISTLIILVTGEFLPKTLFKINPNLVLKVCAFPLLICYVILYPISQLSSGLSYLFLRMFGMKINKEASDKAFGKVDLDYFVQSSIDNAEDEEELDTEVKIFQNALDFSSIKIRDCIVPRTEVVAVDLTTSLEELKSLFVESGISKIIVYDGNIDNVVGYIHSSEMFRNPADWRNNVKEVPIVPETMAAHKLMKLFMQQKKTIAVVVDEFGGTSGIVSLEDLVEEIFGDIEDEHDNTSYVCKQIGESEYVLSGRLEIEKVNETFNLDLPEEDDYMTVGGLILNRYQSFPKLHEVVTIEKFQFKIIKVTATKIELVRLKVGYIHSSEMFRNPADWRNNVKEVPIVPETMAAHKLMKLFMQQKKTIAVVVDEFGGTSGIVSLEDLVEEIFGDIEDEHDNTSYVCKQIGESEYVLSGRLEIEKVNETFNLDLPEEDDYMTVGGLILNRYQSFPKLHEVVTIEKFQFKIIKVTATKIELVRLKVVE